MIGTLLTVGSFFAAKDQWRYAPSHPCPMVGIFSPSNPVLFVIDIYYKSTRFEPGDCAFGQNEGWWSAGWPFAESQDFQVVNGWPYTFLKYLVPIVDILFWSLIAFILLTIFNKTLKKKNQ